MKQRGTEFLKFIFNQMLGILGSDCEAYLQKTLMKKTAVFWVVLCLMPLSILRNLARI